MTSSMTSSYSSLILNFLILNPKNTEVITININVSFHTYINPVPFSIIFFIIVINHLGGIKMLSHCKIFGIFSMGKIKPDSKIVGSIKANREINIAFC